MTMEEIIRQESRVKEARELYGKVKRLKAAYNEIYKLESEIDYFRITFWNNNEEVVRISGDDVKRDFIKWFVRNVVESIEDHIAVIEKDISKI